MTGALEEEPDGGEQSGEDEHDQAGVAPQRCAVEQEHPQGPSDDEPEPERVPAGDSGEAGAHDRIVVELWDLIRGDHPLLHSAVDAHQISRTVPADELVLRIIAATYSARRHPLPSFRSTLAGHFNASGGGAGAHRQEVVKHLPASDAAS